MELVALCVWCFVVACAGGALGLVLGNIRLPGGPARAASPAAGAGANIGISGVAAFAAALAHIRAGRINWRLFAWMAPPSMAGAVVGGLISGAIPDTALLLVIGVALVYFGVDLLRRKPRPRESGSGDALDIRAAVVSGALIGLLGGLVGLILGTLRMPALLRWVGEVPARAVGTNLAVGFWVGAAGVVGHLPGGVDSGRTRRRSRCLGPRRPDRRPSHRPPERAAAAARDRRGPCDRRHRHGPAGLCRRLGSGSPPNRPIFTLMAAAVPPGAPSSSTRGPPRAGCCAPS